MFEYKEKAFKFIGLAIVFVVLTVMAVILLFDGNSMQDAPRVRLNEPFTIQETDSYEFAGDYGRLPTIYDDDEGEEEINYPSFENSSRFELVEVNNDGDETPVLLDPAPSWTTIMNRSYQTYFKVDLIEGNTYVLKDKNTPTLTKDILYYQPVLSSVLYVVFSIVLFIFSFGILIVLNVIKKKQKRSVPKKTPIDFDFD